jgi:hypothetical protein
VDFEEDGMEFNLEKIKLYLKTKLDGQLFKLPSILKKLAYTITILGSIINIHFNANLSKFKCLSFSLNQTLSIQKPKLLCLDS